MMSKSAAPGPETIAQRHAELLGLAAHDVKNPISAALANLAFVEEVAAREPDVSEAIKDATEAIARVRQLVDDLVVLSKHEARTLALRKQPHALDEIARAAAAACAREAELRQVEITTRCEGGVQANVDAAVVRRALDHLAELALRWVKPKGKVAVGVRRAGDRIEAFVSCDARVLAEQPRAKAFLEKGSSAAPGAIGLSLLFAACAAEAHGGELTLARTTEWPTEMILRLP